MKSYREESGRQTQGHASNLRPCGSRADSVTPPQTFPPGHPNYWPSIEDALVGTTLEHTEAFVDALACRFEEGGDEQVSRLGGLIHLVLAVACSGRIDEFNALVLPWARAERKRLKASEAAPIASRSGPEAVKPGEPKE